MADCNVEAVFSKDWAVAQNAVENEVERLLAGTALEELLDTYGKQLSNTPGTYVFKGSGWGALENKRREVNGEAPLSKVCIFPDSTIGVEQSEWVTLLETGALPCPDPLQKPISFLIQHEWKILLEASLSRKGGKHWYSLYVLGLMYYVESNLEKAKYYWELSTDLNPSPWCYRNLALLAKMDRNLEMAVGLMEKAWKLCPAERHLAQEYGSLLIENKQAEKWIEVLKEMPENVRNHPRTLFYEVAALCQLEKLEEASAILTPDFLLPDIREGEISLLDLWYNLHRAKVKQELENNYVLSSGEEMECNNKQKFNDKPEYDNKPEYNNKQSFNNISECYDKLVQMSNTEIDKYIEKYLEQMYPLPYSLDFRMSGK